MAKHIYEITGISAVDGLPVRGTCVDKDIIDAIKAFRQVNISVHAIEQKNQVHADSPISITLIQYPDRKVPYY